VIKLIVTALVDIYPSKATYLPRICQLLKRFSYSKYRILRLSFTAVAQLLCLQLLQQLPPLLQLRQEFKSQPSAKKSEQDKKLKMLDDATRFIREKVDLLMNQVVMPRLLDQTLPSARPSSTGSKI